MFGRKADIQQLQKDFSARVGRPFGVRQAPSRLSGEDKTKAAAAVLKYLRDSEAGVLTCETWPVVRDLIQVDPRPFAEQLGLPIRVRLRTLAELKVSPGRGARKEKSL